MPPKPISKRLSSIAKISGKRRLSQWERVLLGQDITYALSDLTWTITTPMSRPRWRGNAFALLQQLWVVGGYHEDGSVADIEVFDPSTSLWSSIPYPFSYFGQAFVSTSNGLLYAVGGLESCQSLVSPVEEYNPATGLVTQKAALPTPCYNPGIASTPDGKIYVMGGCLPPTSSDPGGPPSAILNTVQIFNPQANTWSVGAPMPSPRFQHSAVTATDGRIYAIGGFDCQTELNRVDIYSPQTNSWQAAATMPTARRHFASVLAYNEKIYAIGGLKGDASLTTVEVFTPASNTWTSSTPLAAGRWYLGAAALGTKLYACGGYMRSGPYQPDNANVSALALVEEGTIQ